MRTRLSAVVGIACLALAACGGSDKPAPRPNVAATSSFTYGAPSAATAAQASAAGTSVGSAAAFALAPSSSSALLLADPFALTTALLGTSGMPAATAGAPSLRALSAPGGGLPSALAQGGFDNPACVTTTATSVTLSGCTVTQDDTTGGTTTHEVWTANGTVAASAATHALSWDLQLGLAVTKVGAQTISTTGSFHLSGSLTVTETTIVGHSGSEFMLTISGGGQSVSFGMDETVDLNLTYADAVTCATRITAGTIEAKRVWTARPQGFAAVDAAAKVTWTACGQATIQQGTH